MTKPNKQRQRSRGGDRDGELKKLLLLAVREGKVAEFQFKTSQVDNRSSRHFELPRTNKAPLPGSLG
jgi:hypothetical protein